nr:MAG TPA: hypothetical protein [Caudoviricetes sp.]
MLFLLKNGMVLNLHHYAKKFQITWNQIMFTTQKQIATNRR